MIKNLLKITLGAFVLCTGFLALNATYATCTASSDGLICNNGESCSDPAGCICLGDLIPNGATCTFGTPGGGVLSDGIPSIISVGGDPLCYDADGCMCNGYLVAQTSSTCVLDGAQTIMTSNGTCNDFEGCMCLMTPLTYLGSCNAFSTPDFTPPTLTAGAVSNTNTLTPSFNFNSSEAGTIVYAGSCTSATTAATAGSNTVTFNSLVNNTTYNMCKIQVTDASSNVSTWLSVPTFTITIGGGGGDTTPPTLTAGAVANTGTASPTFTFTSNEAGTITYSGACTSPTTAATAALQTITFNPLATGTYNNCKIRVTDAASNASLRLAVPTFTLSYTGPVPPIPGAGGGGGGSSQPRDNCTLPGSTLTGANLSGIDYSPSYYDGFCGEKVIVGSNYSIELNNAYLRAYSYGITTMDTIRKANMGGTLIRAHMAKMMSNFAINLGGRTPNISLACDFVDIADQSAELQGYIRLACQLGIMGVNTDGTANSQFNPDDTVDRAQFGTILSRVIWGSVYNGGNPRYGLHLNALKAANIMTLISQPYKGELRGYAMIMMRRTYEEGFLNN